MATVTCSFTKSSSSGSPSLFLHPLRAPLLCVLFLLACDFGLEPGPEPNPAPILEVVDPAVVPAEEEPPSIRLSGLAFVEDAQVLWNGTERTTTFGGPDRLTVELTSADVSEVGSGELVVENPGPGGGRSSAVQVTIGNPRPALNEIAPTSAQALVTSGLTLRVQGSRFAPAPQGAKVLWDGIVLPTVSVDASELRADVSDQLLRDGRTVEVSVVNPEPAGGPSEVRSFEVRNPVPELSNVEPDSVTLGTDATVSLSGSLFVASSAVRYNGSTIAPDLVSDTGLTLSIPGELNTRTGVTVQIENPDPGGGFSNEIVIPVRELPPRLERLSPHAANAGSAGFTMTLVGSDFAPDAVVTWDGEPRTTAFIDEETLEVAVDAADISAADTAEVAVVNPRGGGESQSRGLVVFPEDFPLPEGRIVTPVFASNLDGTDWVEFDVGGGNSRQIDAAPEGRLFLFTKEVEWQRRRIFEFDPITGQERRITSPEHESVLQAEEWPRYAADGAWIYFQGLAVGGEEEEDWSIWRIRPDGTDLEQLTEEDTSPQASPAPSNDGTRVVYSMDGELHILDLRTKASTPLGVAGAVSRWLPGDEWIVYWRLVTLFHLIRPDGSDYRRLLPFAAGGGLNFDVSPDGRHLISWMDANGMKMMLIRIDTGEWRHLPWLDAWGGVGWYDNP